MKEEYKARAKFVRDAGSAMVALVGVNDQLDFTDIKKIGKLMELSKGISYFSGVLGGLDDQNDNYSDEFAWVSSCLNAKHNEFNKEFQSIEEKYPNRKTVEYAIWELEMLAKKATQAAEHLKNNVACLKSEDPFK